MEGRGGHSNLFVGNLTADATEERLRVFFGTYGGVESCRVVVKDGKTSGFVKMADTAGAEAAIAALNDQNGLIVKLANFDVGGKQKMYGAGGRNQAWGNGSWGKGYGKGWGSWGYVGGWASPSKLLPREDEPEKPEGPPSENLYVKHWPVGVTEDDIKATFQKAGEVVECRLLRPENSLEWAALVRMATPEQAAAARHGVDENFPVLPEQPLSVAIQVKNSQPKEDHCYVKTVPTNTTKEKLEALFAKYGEVQWCDVMPSAMRGNSNASSSALVQMGSPEQCQKAIAALNEQVIPFGELGGTIRVRYALIKDKPADSAAA